VQVIISGMSRDNNFSPAVRKDRSFVTVRIEV